MKELMFGKDGEKNHKNIAIQGLRGLLGLMIFLAHSDLHSNAYIGWLGEWGVQVFLVLAGFCNYFSRSTDGMNISVSNCFRYGLKKIKKLYPLYCVVTIIAIPLALLKIFIMKEGNIVFLIERIITNFLLINTLFFNKNIVSLSGTGWFLATIFFIYMFNPILKRFFSKYNAKTNILFLIIVFALRCILSFAIRNTSFSDAEQYVYFSPIIRVFDFAMGINLAIIYKSYKDIFSKHSVLINVFTFLSIASVYALWNYNNSIKYLALTVNAILIIVSASIQKGIVKSILNNKFLVYIGDRNEYLFLIHFVIIEYFVGLEILGINFNKYVITAIQFLLSMGFIEIWKITERKIFPNLSN